jgi:hypothetical protein
VEKQEGSRSVLFLLATAMDTKDSKVAMHQSLDMRTPEPSPVLPHFVYCQGHPILCPLYSISSELRFQSGLQLEGEER